MSGFLLDTNVISELVRPKPEARVLGWMDATDESLLYLSALTLGEIRKSVASRILDKRRTRLETWLEIEQPARFAGRILPIDEAVADRWGVLSAAAKQLPVIEGLIAATALHHHLTVVSRNDTDFAPAHVQVLNPWKA